MPPAALMRSVAAKHGADSSLPNCAAGPVKGAMTPAVIGPDCVGTEAPEGEVLELPHALTMAITPIAGMDTRQPRGEPMENLLVKVTRCRMEREKIHPTAVSTTIGGAAPRSKRGPPVVPARRVTGGGRCERRRIRGQVPSWGP